MRTRIVQKKSGTGKKVMVWLVVLVILAGIGAGSYVYKPWEQDWFPISGAKPVKAAAKKSQDLTPVVIHKVSFTDVTPIVQVKGNSKINAQAKSFFDKINSLELKPQKQFSYNEWFATVKAELASTPEESTYSYLAALLYEAAVKSGFQVGERHLHQQLPAYASPGFDVFVIPESNGLSLFNPKEFIVLVQMTYADDFPVISLSALPEAGWKPVDSQIKQTKYAQEQVDISDQSLAVGTQEIKDPGKEGMLVEVTVGGQMLSKDFYLPLPIIVGHGPVPKDKQPDQNEPIAG
jgi:hypothetical protein